LRVGMGIRPWVWATRVAESRFEIRDWHQELSRRLWRVRCRHLGYGCRMNEKSFAGYLNDHLGGSEAALKITDRLVDQHDEDEIGAFMRTLRTEIEEGQAAIRAVLDLLGEGESVLTRSVGAVGGMLMWLRDAAPMGNAPTLLEDLEALAIGVWGKRLLWGTMARATLYDPRLAVIDTDGLARQAESEERELLRLRSAEIERGLELGQSAA
jgi:hypothetical protein